MVAQQPLKACLERPFIMATSAESLVFRHNPLQDAKTHIRLLKVVSVDDTRPVPVHCELTTFPITGAPPYRAISYTWGDPASPTAILVNGEHMEVRVNCEYALRQASQRRDDEAGDSFVWIDSICINQHDNNEKSAQVAMMGEVFRTASQVLACIGAHEDDSGFLYQFLRGKTAKIRRFLQLDAPRYHDGTFIEDSRCFLMEELSWRWKHSRSFLLRLCEALAKFLGRPYFHRVWIYQELFLGRDVDVCCGDDRVPVSWVWVTSSIIKSWLFRSTNYWLFMDIDTLLRVRSPIWEAIPLLVAGAKEQVPRPLAEVTEEVSTLSCEDPRDRVYGILSVITPIQDYHFQPDYTKDRLDLAVEVVQGVASEIANSNHGFLHMAGVARTVGLNLMLQDDPTQTLICAMDLRRSAINLPNRDLEAFSQRRETENTTCWDFLGIQILLQQEKWTLPNQAQWSRRYGTPFVPPKLSNCQHGKSFSDISVDIHLPSEAQDGDWLLMPHSYYHLTLTDESYSKIAFIARQSDSDKFEIIGKVLISRWVSKWGSALEECASEFQFHCDSEDLLVLLASCKWDYLSFIRSPVEPEASDDYFETRFCGRRFSSYAVRTETQVTTALVTE